MPVVVTGADSLLGLTVVDMLVRTGAEVRATVDVRAAVASLVERGVKTAVSDLVDTERFGGVVEGAHTVVHLRGEIAALDQLDDVLSAVEESGVRRIVTVARTVAPEVADRLRSSGYDVVVVLLPRRPRGRSLLRLARTIVDADAAREEHGYVERRPGDAIAGL